MGMDMFGLDKVIIERLGLFSDPGKRERDERILEKASGLVLSEAEKYLEENLGTKEKEEMYLALEKAEDGKSIGELISKYAESLPESWRLGYRLRYFTENILLGAKKKGSI